MTAVIGKIPTSDLDPFSAEFRSDPYAHYEELRRLGPIVRLERYDIWAVARYDEVRQVLTDWRRFSNAGGGGIRNYFKEKPWRPPSIILEVDPPEHERARTILTRVLSAAVLAGLRQPFEVEATRLIERAIAKSDIDGVADLAEPFPLTVFPDAVGLEREGRENLLIYGAMVFGAFGPSTAWYEDLVARAEAVIPWILARCRRGALAPDGIGSAIYKAADSGEATEEEAGLLVRSLLSAGVDTTIDALSLTLHALASHQDQWLLLREDASLARAAFEEANRFDSSSQSLFRTTIAETEFGGVRIGKHEKVIAFNGSANRDPAQWPEPDRFDIRRRTAGHLSFGAGIHGCVAQMMARIEGEVFLRVLARKVERLEITGEAKLRLNVGLRGFTCLPMAVGARRVGARGTRKNQGRATESTWRTER